MDGIMTREYTIVYCISTLSMEKSVNLVTNKKKEKLVSYL